MAKSMTPDYAHAGSEPTLIELFHDPVVRAMMRRDRVDDDALCRVIAIGRIRLGLERFAARTPCAERHAVTSRRPCCPEQAHYV